MGNLKKFKKIVILSGGISDEKEISELTSKEVFDTLQNHYDVKLINVTQNCQSLVKSLLQIKPDVVFNCLHGFFGEDGQIQSILNYLNLPYTHSGVMTSSVLMNKEISKKIFSSMGVKSPPSMNLDEINQKKILSPFIVKPINGGSSNGLLKINNEREFNLFIKKNKKKLKNFLFEKFIDGREITVGILNNKICGIMEIVFDSEIYDYKNKYIQIAQHIINPDLPSNIKENLCEISLNVHKNTNCNCISRLDYRYDQKKEEFFLLEVNTQPGLTKNSLLPEMAKDSGINFFQLCEILIENSLCESL